MKIASSALFTAALVCLMAAPAFAVKGEWLTDPDQALAVAQASKTPILAVAMDHG